MAAEHHPVQLVCRVLDISESRYYDRKNRAPSQRAIRHAWLTDLIRQIHLDSRRTYGARRVHAELRLGHGVEVGHGAVEMLMRRAGDQRARHGDRHPSTTGRNGDPLRSRHGLRLVGLHAASKGNTDRDDALGNQTGRHSLLQLTTRASLA